MKYRKCPERRLLSALLCLALLLTFAPEQAALPTAGAETAQESAQPLVGEEAPGNAQGAVESDAAPIPDEEAPGMAAAEELPVSAEDDAPALPGPLVDDREEGAGEGSSQAEEESGAPVDVAAEDVPIEGPALWPIDYTAPADASPSFAQGFAELLQETVPLYAQPAGEARAIAALGRGVVYALERSSAPDRLHIAYCAGGEAGTEEGWVEASALRPMDPEAEVPAYLGRCAASGEAVEFWGGIPLLPLPCESVESKEDFPPVGEQTDAQEPRPTEHPVLLPEMGTEPAEGEALVASPGISSMPLPVEEPLLLPEDLTTRGLTLGVGMKAAFPSDVLASDIPLDAASGEEVTFACEGDAASVAQDGTITALLPGTARVLAYRNGIPAASVNLTVLPGTGSIHLAQEELLLAVGEEGVRIEASADEGTMAEFSYEIDPSDAEKLSVDAEGYLTAREAGAGESVRVTVRDRNCDSEAAPACVLVQISASPTERSQMKLTQNEMQLGVGDSYQIGLSAVDPSTGSQSGLIVLEEGLTAGFRFLSSDSNVASVSKAGKITARKAGSAVIRIGVEGKAGIYRDLRLTVSRMAGSFSLSPEGMRIGANMQAQLEPVFPAGTSALVEYESSDPSLLTVNAETGTLTAGGQEAIRSPQSVTIFARLKHAPSLTASCSVTVLPAPGDDGIAMDYSGLNCVESDAQGEFLRLGVKEEGAELSARCLDADTLCDFRYALSAGDPDGLLVSETGELTPKLAGEYAVEVTAANNANAHARARILVASAPEELKLHPGKDYVLQLGVGDTYRIAEYALDAETGEESGILELLPEGASASYSYKSDKGSVASVNGDGVITARKKGKAIIRIATQKAKVYCELHVRVWNAAQSFSLTPAVQFVGECSGGQVEARFPSGSFGTIGSYTSSNPDLLSMQADGHFSVGKLAGGEAEEVCITAATRNGLTATARVTVLPHPTQVSFSETEYLLSERMTLATALLLPDGQMAQHFRYVSTDESVATIDSAGVLTGLREGRTTIRVTANPEEDFAVQSEEVSVRVIAAPARLDYDEGLPNPLKIMLHDEVLIPEPVAYSASGEMIPAGYSYESSNPNYVKVSGNRMIAKKVGKTVTITAHAQNSSAGNPVTASFRVRVYSSKADRVTLYCGDRKVNDATLRMYVNAAHPTDQLQLSATVEGTNINCGTVKYSSSDETVATVTEDGRITALAVGNARITAVAVGGTSAGCELVVGQRCRSVVPDLRPLTLSEGATEQLSFTFVPEGSGMRLRFETSDPEVVSVSDGGVVQAIGGGEAEVRLFGQGGDDLGSVSVCVLYNPDSLTLYARKLYMDPGDSLVLTPQLRRTGIEAPEKVNVWTTARSDNPLVAGLKKESEADQNAGTAAGYRLTAQSTGTATLTFRACNGLEASCVVTVNVRSDGKDASSFAWEEGKKLAMIQGDSVELELGLSADVYRGEKSCKLKMLGSSLTLTEGAGATQMLRATRPGTATLDLQVDGETVDTVEVEVVAPMEPELWYGQNMGEPVEEQVELDAGVDSDGSTNHSICIDVLPELDDTYVLLGMYEVSFEDTALLTFDRASNRIHTTSKTGKTKVTVRTFGSERSFTVRVAEAPVYRALLISEYNGEGGSARLPFAQRNIDNMKATLSRANIRGRRYESIKVRKNPSKAGILSAILTTFADAKKNDVSLIYIVSHGHTGVGSTRDQYAFSMDGYSTKNPNSYVRDDELMKWLKAIPGRVVLLLDSCRSGSFISHQKSTGGLKENGKIAVIAAQVANRGAGFYVKRKEKEATFEFFTRSFCLGLGHDQEEGWGERPFADANENHLVSLAEAYNFAKAMTQATAKEYRDYFEGDGTGFIAPGFNSKAKAKTFEQVPQSYIPTSMKQLPIFGA